MEWFIQISLLPFFHDRCPILTPVFFSYNVFSMNRFEYPFIATFNICIKKTVYLNCHAVLNTNHPSSALRSSPVQPVYICLWVPGAVNDLSETLPEGVTCHQYADDTTFYSHCKPSCMQECQAKMQKALDVLKGNCHEQLT